MWFFRLRIIWIQGLYSKKCVKVFMLVQIQLSIFCGLRCRYLLLSKIRSLDWFLIKSDYLSIFIRKFDCLILDLTNLSILTVIDLINLFLRTWGIFEFLVFNTGFNFIRVLTRYWSWRTYKIKVGPLRTFRPLLITILAKKFLHQKPICAPLISFPDLCPIFHNRRWKVCFKTVTIFWIFTPHVLYFWLLNCFNRVSWGCLVLWNSLDMLL